MASSGANKSFAHLHQHTEYSMLDGAARVREVVATAAADGQPAIAITDHGNMYGVLDFYRECRERDITPIIGTEAYMAANSRLERPVRRGRLDDTGGEGDRGEKLYYHLTVLAETGEGYANLMKLSSDAYLEGYYYKPRCLLPGQEIVTRSGVKPVEEIEPGDEVLTHRGRFRRVIRTMTRQHDGEIVGLRLAGHYRRTTWVTPEHPILIRGRDGIRTWIDAGDVIAGRPSSKEAASNWNSWVCLPRLAAAECPVDKITTADYVSWQPSSRRPGSFERMVPRKRIGPTWQYAAFPDRLHLDYELGYFFGLYLAEGHIYRTEVRWSFHEDEIELIDRCRVMADKLTGRSTVDRRPDRTAYQGTDVRCSSSLLAELLRELMGSGARNKHLPPFAFDAPRDFQQGLVDGAVDGDGGIKPSTIAFAQTSRNLAWQIRTLQASLVADFPCIREMPVDSEQHAPLHWMNLSPRGPQRFRHTLSDQEFVYKPVAAVERRDYHGPVFNFEVEDDHSYVSDFAMHNCDWDLLERYHSGLIATTGCLGGVVLQALLNEQFDEAKALAGRLQDIFGRDNLFIELQDHGLDEQRRTNPHLLEIAKAIKAPIVATNDSHYCRREDAVSHDALLCVQTGAMIDDPKRFKFHGDEHYLKTAAEMRQLFGEVPEACDNTLWIAERARVEIELGNPKLPEFEVPPEFARADYEDAAEAYLRHLVTEGARMRYGDPLPEAVVDRLEYELGVIASMGFPAYFLVVWDLIRHARDHGIRVGPGRGSAAGSCVAYCLRIVEIDPIRNDLIFERFLNPGRKQMPDIDMDFDERYRSEMIRYASERYGWDRVAQIVTFSTIKARAAVRDAARVLGYPYALGDRIAKAMPPLVMGRDTPLWACLERSDGFDDGFVAAQSLREMYEADPDAKKVIDVAKGLEGLRRQDGIHAAAVVITNDPLTEYLPIQRKPEPGADPADAPIVTQYEMHGVEELGLLKMDFLGLRNLSVIETALDLIEGETGERPDIDNVVLDDDATYDLLRAGDSIGVFQLEGTAMRALMRSLAPSSFDDVAALVALYRPGPMAANMHRDYADRKNNRQPVTYLHADLEPILADTYGLMIYQESVMRVAQRFAGYTLEEADNLRKAAGKKVRSIMAAEREKFVQGCVTEGYGEELGTKLFDIIEPFADYAFNKSHSYGYGLVAYQTAWLKANHPVEYLAALLSSVKDDKDKSAVYLAECRAIGIEVLVPDVNASASNFRPRRGETEGGTKGAIIFGLSAVRNVGEGLVALIEQEREKNGSFADFHDFCCRVDPSVLNKRSVESLIKAGAFDSLGHPRKGLCLVFEEIIDHVLTLRREAELGISTLFSLLTEDADAPSSNFGEARREIPDLEFSKNERLAFEKEMLGLYVSDHPLAGFEAALRRMADVSIAELVDQATGNGGSESQGGGFITVGGVVTNLSRRYTKRGELMATFTLEDLEASIEVFCFPRTMQEYGMRLESDAIVCIRGRLDVREDEAKLVAAEITRPEFAPDDANLPIEVAVPVLSLTETLVARLHELVIEHPGSVPVHLRLGDKLLRLPPQFNVDPGGGFVGALKELFGAQAVGA